MDIKGKTTVRPYLTFNGNCQEALSFYKEATCGELHIMPFRGSPVDIPDGYEDKVLHGTVVFGDAVIMASDSIPGQESTMGSHSHIMVSCHDLDDAEMIFNNLSDCGTVIVPFAEAFWGAKFGMFTDKFGISWMVHCELEDSN